MFWFISKTFRFSGCTVCSISILPLYYSIKQKFSIKSQRESKAWEMTRLWLTYSSDCLDPIVSSLRAYQTSRIRLAEQRRVRWYTTYSIALWVSSSRSSPGSHPPISNLGYDGNFFSFTQSAQHWFRRHQERSCSRLTFHFIMKLQVILKLWKRNQNKCHFHLAHTANNVCPPLERH